MSDKTARNFLIFPPQHRFTGLGFYQQLLQGIESYRQLGNRLIEIGEQAYALRRFEKIREVGILLSNIPTKSYQSIGYYFLAVAANHNGNGDQQKARKLFELVADTAPSSYKAKAILSLAAVSFNTRDFESAFLYYNEAIKASRLSVASIGAIRGMALLKSIEGYHHQALKDLESLLPIAKQAPPHIYFDYLNSLAVELGQAGRKEEARNISKVVLASPYAIAYPEWRETAQELMPANRSFVFIDRSLNRPRNVLALPRVGRKSTERPDRAGQPGKLLGYEQGKQRLAEKKKQQSIDAMSSEQMMYDIIHLFSSASVSYELRRKAYEALRKVILGPEAPDDNPDDEKPGA